MKLFTDQPWYKSQWLDYFRKKCKNSSKCFKFGKSLPDALF